MRLSEFIGHRASFYAVSSWMNYVNELVESAEGSIEKLVLIGPPLGHN